METNRKYVSAYPNPQPFDVRKRLEELRNYLNKKHPDYQPEEQHVNIRAAIKFYEDGVINGFDCVHIIDGKLVPREDLLSGKAVDILKRGTPRWREGMCYQYAQKFSYGHGPHSLAFHEIRLFIRLVPDFGGDGHVHTVGVLNDTGSDILSIDQIDLQQLGNIQGYTGWLEPCCIGDANGGRFVYPSLLLQVRLLRNDDSPWSDWIFEEAIVKQHGPNLARLSGSGIRQALYIGTAPGNHTLAVAATKGGLNSLL